MRPGLLIILTLLGTMLDTVRAESSDMPKLDSVGAHTQLIVDREAFLILGGELGNSSASSDSYMAPVWPRLKAANLNTVLAPVYWELIEPQEGNFDFSSVDTLIRNARQQDLKLVLLWFGAWKNSMSTYVPTWVKTDPERFPRAQDENGIRQEILTPFSATNLQADQLAFAKLMQHLRKIDNKHNTVIMVQVENEIGMLPSARDHSPMANDAFSSAVPEQLVAYLEANELDLVESLKLAWSDAGKATSGDWETVFGSGTHTEEFFMAWYYARFANALAVAGKQAYALPMYVNAALNRPGREPGSGYPSAGPLPHLRDIWKAGAPDIDLLAPDFYTPRFEHWNDLYAAPDNALFIPEHRFDQTAAPKSLFAIGHYAALGFAPFSIETGSTENLSALAQTYSLLQQLQPVIVASRQRFAVDAVLFDKDSEATVLEFGGYRFTCRHDFTLGWSAAADKEEWPTSSAIIVQTGSDEFYVAGSGVVITFESLDDNSRAGILEIDEGVFEAGRWKPGRRLNGDQTHQGRHLRIPVGQYDIQRLTLYQY